MPTLLLKGVLDMNKPTKEHLQTDEISINEATSVTDCTGLFPTPPQTEEEFDLNYVFGDPVYTDVNYAISNSLGFGGHNASILIGKYE